MVYLLSQKTVKHFKTPKYINIKELCGGEYIYFGIKKRNKTNFKGSSKNG